MSDKIIKTCTIVTLRPTTMVAVARLAVTENPVNAPAFRFTPGLGVAGLHPVSLAALTGKKWSNGRTLRVRFLDGDPVVQTAPAALRQTVGRLLQHPASILETTPTRRSASPSRKPVPGLISAPTTSAFPPVNRP